jgi:hypothetical protein
VTVSGGGGDVAAGIIVGDGMLRLPLVLEELKGTGGRILKTSLSHEDEGKLQAALNAATAKRFIASDQTANKEKWKSHETYNYRI